MSRISARRTKASKTNHMVEFRYQNIDYQIDPEKRRVYRNWVSVESAKTFLIMSAWSNPQRQDA